MYIKRPGGSRRSYALVDNSGKTVKDKRIDAVNKDLKGGTPLEELEARMQVILAQLSGKRHLVLAPSNLRVVEALHKKKILRKPYLINPEGLKRQLIRSVEEIGHTSVLEATEEELLEAISHVKKPASRRDIIRSLNEILRFANRDFRLPNPKVPTPVEIAYIRISEFLSKADRFEQEYGIYLGALFATGCRFAELPCIHLREDAVYVDAQIRKDGSRGLTKGKEPRMAPIIPPLKDYVVKAVALGPARLKELRLEHYDRIYGACKKILGIRIHDLRHSYVVEWGAQGRSLSELANFIGDDEKTCADHYRNYCATDDVIKRAVQAWKG